MAFATSNEVGTRIGRALTAAEVAQVNATLNTLDGLIRDEVDKPADWVPVPVPAALAELSIQKAIGAIANPQNVATYSESLGAYSYSSTFQRSQDGGVFISDAEGRILRQAVYGATTGTGYPRSVADRFIDLAEGRDVDKPG